MAYQTRELGPGCVRPGDTCYLHFGGRKVSATVMSVDSMGMVYWPESRGPPPRYIGFRDLPLPLVGRTRDGINLRLIRPTRKEISDAANPN